jgi:anaerobic selenocysteine-containing dehydrogenase
MIQSAGSASLTKKTFTTTCVLDCPDACALLVTTQGEGDEARIRHIGGDPDHPTTAGFICKKVARFHHRVEHPERLLYPMVRKGPKGSGSFERISWAAAEQLIAGRLGEIRHRWGGEAILPYHYGGSNGLLQDEFLDHLFFARLGSSRLAKTLCAEPTTVVAREMYGKMPGVAYEDYPAARFILLWGANPKVSGIHLVPFLKRAKERGAFVAVVDPLRNFSSQEVDLHLPIYPGSDLPVALAMIGHWQSRGQLAEKFLAAQAVDADALLQAAQAWPLERAAALARVPAESLRSLAERYAAASPAVLRCGWGIERNRNGGAAAAAVLAMPALLGKFGKPGGGYTMSNNGGARVDREAVLPMPRWQTRGLNMTQLAEILNGSPQPPVKALFVYNCNPVATVPDQNGILRGLAREDLFTVVAEQVMTDTARYADVLLPATTFMEHRDLRVGYGSYTVGGTQAVIPAPGEVRSNVEIFAALGRALGFEDEAFQQDEETLYRRLLGAVELAGAPAQEATLETGRFQLYDFPGSTPVQLVTVQPQTADGKIHLCPPSLGKDPFRYLPLDSPWPLALLSPATHRRMNSTFGELDEEPLTVTLHPQDAADRGLGSGDTVRVFNELGEVHCPLRVSDRCRSGVVLMPKGAWRRHTSNGQTATALCPASVQRVGGGACYSDARVEVEKVRQETQEVARKSSNS